MLVIRLSRMGKKKQPTYRVVVQEKGRDPWGNSVDIVGHYDPRAVPKEIVVKADRVRHWIAQGAQPSPTVHNLLVSAGVIEGEKVKNTTKDLKHMAKANKDRAEKAKKAAEEKAAAEKAAAEAAKAEEEKAAAAAAEDKPAEEPAPEAEATTESE